MTTDTTAKADKKTRYALRLYVAGNAPNSRIARDNLKRLQARYPEYEFAVEVIDLYQNPGLALEHGVFVSPALQILEPGSGSIVYGNLSEERILEQALNL